MRHLFIKFVSVPEPKKEESFEVLIDWAILDNTKTLIGSGNTDARGLMDLSDLNNKWATDYQITILLPNDWSVVTSFNVPGRNAAQITKALPFLAEEFVSSDVENLHIATEKVRVGQPTLCHLIEKSILSKCLKFLDFCGITATRVILLSDLLRELEKTANIFLIDDDVLLKTPQSAIQVNQSNLITALNSLNEEYSTIYQDNYSLSELELSELEQKVELSGPGQQTDAKEWVSLLGQFNEKNCLNLLQGEFKVAAPRISTSGEVSSLLKVAGICFLIVAGFFLTEGIWAGYRSNDYSEEAFKTYLSIFPDESKPITNSALLRRVNAKLNRTLNDDSSLDFLDRIDIVSRTFPKNSSIINFSYNADTQELVLISFLENYDALDVLKQNLLKFNLQLETNNAEEEQGKVRARLRIKDDTK